MATSRRVPVSSSLLSLRLFSNKSVLQPRTVSICKSTHNSAKTYRTGPVFLAACILVSLAVLFPSVLSSPFHSSIRAVSRRSPPEMEIAENSTPSTKLRWEVCWVRGRWYSCRRISVVYLFSRGRHVDRLLVSFSNRAIFVISFIFRRENRRTCSIRRMVDITYHSHFFK